MNEFIKALQERIAAFSARDAVDIVLLAGILFLLYRFVRRRRAFPILIGVLGFLILSTVAEYCGLSAITSVTSAIRACGVVLLAIAFQPELRAALEKSGDAFLGFMKLITGERAQQSSNYNAVKVRDAVLDLSKTKTGALIILEGNSGTDDIAKHGVKLDALISTELIKNIFCAGTPLHDGAVIIRGGRIHTAACYVLVNSEYVPVDSFGARHNAGRSLSANSDSISIIVSEENGSISCSKNGELMYDINERELETILNGYFPAKARKSFEKRLEQESDAVPPSRERSDTDHSTEDK